VEKSFQVAASNLKNPKAVRHPSKRNLQLVDAYPLLPDLDSFPDVGGYVTIKFLTNPVPPSTTYDIRIENSLLKPIEGTDEEELAKQQAREAYERDPERNPPPDDSIEYEFFMAETPSGALNFKRKFDALDPDHDDEDLYTEKNGSGEGCFRFKRIRAYESALQTGTTADKYDEEVVVALHDGKDGLRQKGAYYYPIVQRTNIRPQRQKNINKKMKRIMTNDEDRITDYVDVKVEEANEEMKAARDLFAVQPFPPEEEEGAEEEQEQEGSKSPERRNGEEDGNRSDS